MRAVVFLLVILSYQCVCSGSSVVNIVPGIFSKKTESDGLRLPATNTYQPISTLTTTIHLTKPYTAFVHYQVTLGSTTAFYSKLLINYANAGSVVHVGNHHYKTATGFYMGLLNPGYYTFEVHYRSASAFNIEGGWDWQTAVLQVIWAEDAKVVSSGIKCLPTPPATNTYDNFGPIKDLETVITIPSDRVVLTAYQLSVDMASENYVVTALNSDGFFEPSTSFLQGLNSFLSLHGVHAKHMYTGIHYYNLLYRSSTRFSLADCVENYKNNKNMYAMMMPSSCKAVTVHPKTSFTLGNTDKWAATDLSYSLTLTKNSHVIVVYQFSGWGGNYIVMRLKIDSAVQKHTVSLVGKTIFAGNFGLWQGSLNAGDHSFVVEYRSPTQTTNTVSAELTYRRWNKWMNRAMTIIYC